MFERDMWVEESTELGGSFGYKRVRVKDKKTMFSGIRFRSGR